MYPLIPSEDQLDRYFVKEIELAGIAPQNFFRFVTNRYGSTSATGRTTDAERRKSQGAQTDYPELFNFVNDPDPAIWPSATAPTFTVDVKSGCNTATNGGKSTFNLNTSESSTFVVLINLNGVAGYQPGTADVLLESTGTKGSRTVEWNGLNGLNQIVAKNTTINYFFRNNSSPIHFPVWDAEANADGFRVQDVRPVAGSNYDGLLFWDDSNLPTSSFPSPQSELFGAVSTNGVHRWGSATTSAGDLKTVNTWTYGYTGSSTQSATFTYDCSADVAVTNTAAAAPYTIGKPFTYTVTATNNGPITASNVQVTDKLDLTKLEFVSSSDAANYNTSTGIWNIGALAVGASKTLTITAKPLVLGTISTTATQTHTEVDNVASNNSATASITVQAAADIEVKNFTDKTAYNNGDLVTYTVTAKNFGPNAATGVVITDKLPAGLTLEGTAPTGYDAATGNWTVGALAVNETKTLTLTARATALGAITTTADLGSRTGFELDENAGNNTSSVTINVSPSADVAVTNVVSNTTPNQNSAITFTFRAINNGPNNATNVVLSSPIPAGLTPTAFTPSTGSVSVVSGVAYWTVGTIQPSATQTLVVTAVPTLVGTFTLTATQTHTENDNVASNNSASQTITVRPTADVAVTNTVSAPAGTTYENDEEVTYTVVVRNNGPSTATNVVVTDQFPTSLQISPAQVTTGTVTTTASTGKGEWTIPSMASGATATLTVKAIIKESAVITTTASQTHTEFDNVAGNNSASNTIQSGSGIITADIVVAVSTPSNEYYTRDLVPFKVVVRNAGPDAATNVTVDAALPAGFTLNRVNATTGTYSNGIWTIPTLADGASTELILMAVPNADATVTGDKNYTFTASRTGTAEQVDNVASNNTASTSLVVRKKADVKAELTVVSNDPEGKFYNGISEATFTIKVTNNGPDRVTNLAGRDTRTGTLNTPFYLATSEGTVYNFETGIWSVGSLESGQSATLTLKAVPNTTGRLALGGRITNQDQYDAITENNTAVALLNVLPVAELAVTNTASAATFYNGQETSFTVRLQNNGPDAATGVVIEDKLPAGLSFVSATATSGSYDPATGRWTLDSDVLPGAANAQTLVIRVKPQSAITYTTTASVVASGQYDQVTSNNSQQASIQGTVSADIALSSIIEAGPYYVGGQYKVTITATNIGPDPATGVAVTAGVAPGLTLVPVSGSPDAGTSINPATGIWTIGNLGVNETKTVSLLVQPTALGVLNSIGYKSAGNEFDPNGGSTKDGNNTTIVYITAVDRKAKYQVIAVNKHPFAMRNGDNIAEATDQDGPINNAKVVNGTLPAGLKLESNGDIEVSNRFALVAGTYTITIETADAIGGMTQNTISFRISDDWDNDGVPDALDLDDNNDGIFTSQVNNATDGTADADGDGIPNFLDKDFIHPLYGAFRDKNHDDINDAFDLDLDGLIKGFDTDIDGDGIPNAVESNGGIVPSSDIYNAAIGVFKGSVNANGIPIVLQPSNNNTASILSYPDTDKDGIRDYEDLDSDNDGILDNYEAQATSSYINGIGLDSDLDGLSDEYDATTGGTSITPVDTDKDGTPDYLDLDSDNDMSMDYVEGFDDNNDGKAMDDLMERARLFEDATSKGWYVNTIKDKDGTPQWLKLTNGYPNYLTKGSAYYHDTNNDGIIDLFDTDNGGRGASMQTEEDNEYAYRTAAIVTPLPVTMISFTAKVQKDGVQLEWATAAEKNNDFFSVERSTDGKNFSVVGQVKGGGNSNVLLNYGFLDNKSVSGTSYYRLKQVDFDGKFEYSKIIAVQTKAAAAPQVTVKAYPNPTTDAVNLDLTNVAPAKVMVKVFALDGRMVKTVELEGGAVQKLDLTNVATGTYLLKLAGNGFETVLRVVKQ
ncbi:T9SS type A sorting domain-containing protein [Rufibacter immobilis]|uniref:T9SS type A sorting domain-containing protein n=1 Tax=Rufibacter immobilis TaxID=1348778 RepID=UPI0035EAF3B7